MRVQEIPNNQQLLLVLHIICLICINYVNQYAEIEITQASYTIICLPGSKVVKIHSSFMVLGKTFNNQPVFAYLHPNLHKLCKLDGLCMDTTCLFGQFCLLCVKEQVCQVSCLYYEMQSLAIFWLLTSLLCVRWSFLMGGRF